MSQLRRTLVIAVIYLGVIFVLGETDYMERPIINFASYFYLAVMIAFPVTFLFPSISSVSWAVPLAVWAGIYLVVLQTINRENSATTGEFAIVVVEFALLELGVWVAHGLAKQIHAAESIMDAMALSAFPNRAHAIEMEDQRIRIELMRSRRYNRPLSLIIISAEPDIQKLTKEVLKSLQNDLYNRFNSARVGQIIDDQIRQTDIVLRDHRGRFLVLCPETDLTNAALLVRRIANAVKQRTDLSISCAMAAFPEEALTFDDLLQKAKERIALFKPEDGKQDFINNSSPSEQCSDL